MGYAGKPPKMSGKVMADLNESQLETLAQCEVFAGLSEQDLLQVAGLGAVQSFPKGALIIEENAEGHELFVVLEGQVGIEVDRPKEVDSTFRLRLLGRSACVGEIALLDENFRSASVRCNSQVSVLAIPHSSMLELCRNQPTLGLALMSNLGQILAVRLKEANCQLRNLLSSLSF